MKHFRVIALLLAVLMLAAVFAACKKPGNESSSSGEEVTGDGLYHATNLPNDKYDGYVYRVLDVHNNTNMYTDFDAEADSTNKVSAAQYNRNRRIEAKYDIEFAEDRTDTWQQMSDTFLNYVNANSDEYEMNMVIQRDAFSFGVKGYVAPTPKLTYCDPTQPWYVHDVNDMLTVNDIQFFAYSAECLNMFAQTQCVYFNKQLMDDNQLENPYELVDGKAWTYDKFLSSAKAVTKDLNQDFVYDEDDMLGITTFADNFYATMWIGAGFKTIEKNEDDYPVMTAQSNEAFIDFLGGLGELYAEHTALFDTYNIYGEAGNGRGVAWEVFRDGHSLYYVGCILNLPEFGGDMIDDFGIVPVPTLNEGDDFHSSVLDGWIYIVPNTNTHLDMTSVILEELAVESKNYVYDAYYQEILKNRYSRDSESVRMLDLISETRDIDFGNTIWQADVRWKIFDAIWSGSNVYSSRLKSISSYMDLMIDMTLEDLEDTYYDLGYWS